ncbi:MAG: glucuronate isomerase [Oscillospiraceae bacterium]|nr:glucuronate isomerase [Oscillospiraceae bacterium]
MREIRNFCGEDFLLNSKFARALYYDYAAKNSIIDYHCQM